MGFNITSALEGLEQLLLGEGGVASITSGIGEDYKKGGLVGALTGIGKKTGVGVGGLAATGLFGKGAQNLMLGKPGKFSKYSVDPNNPYYQESMRKIGERYMDPSQDPLLAREIRSIQSRLGPTSTGAKGVMGGEALARHTQRAGDFMTGAYRESAPIVQYKAPGTGLAHALWPSQQYQQGRTGK